MSRVELKNIEKYYGKNHVLKDLNLTVEDGEFMTLLGPSGCGKTTTLRIIAGLDRPEGGTMTINGKEMINAQTAVFADPAKRGLNLVFQSYALWPHMSVKDNIEFGLKVAKLPRAEIDRRVEESLSMLRITEYADRYPNELSGGQQQRVAIARAIASHPKLLLLDEPLSNLDARLRIDMRSELQRMHSELHTTIIYVTHDQTEALTLSTRIALYKKGELVQVSTPMELYRNPVTLEAADFIGNPRINFLQGKAKRIGDTLHVDTAVGVFQFDRKDFTDEAMPEGEFDVVAAIRPEDVLIVPENTPGAVRVRVYANQPAGSETLTSLLAGDGKTTFIAKSLGLRSHAIDEEVSILLDPDSVNIYAAESQRLIRRVPI